MYISRLSSISTTFRTFVSLLHASTHSDRLFYLCLSCQFEILRGLWDRSAAAETYRRKENCPAWLTRPAVCSASPRWQYIFKHELTEPYKTSLLRIASSNKTVDVSLLVWEPWQPFVFVNQLDSQWRGSKAIYVSSFGMGELLYG